MSPASEVGRWLTGVRIRAVLVRPDRVVCATARRTTDIARLLAHATSQRAFAA
ncbi:hypothetical protein [Candidatus Frankia alpina]|uniref:hypothetical protein n=1 Tax=Candidatus Frankia alpina TaxID=2699483 RepID=UPI00138688D6|nr:hypothetical protein [Candidatus Frankia alpina]